MDADANTKSGNFTSYSSFLVSSHLRRFSTSQFCQGSKTVTVIALLALLVLQSPLAFLSISSYQQNHFLAFATLSPSQSETITNATATPSSSFSSLSRPLTPEQSLQFQSLDQSSAPSTENFGLPNGYVIEPFMWNLSFPTSIAVDSSNGVIYVAESTTNENDILDGTNNNSNSNLSTTSASSSSTTTFPASLSSPQQPPEVRILKTDLGNGDNSLDSNQLSDIFSNQSSDIFGSVLNTENDTVFNNTLTWPVIDMKTDANGEFLYAFHDHSTISRINTTSGGREDIISSDESGDTDNNNFDNAPLDPLSLIINSSSQIALDGMDGSYYYYPHTSIDDQRSTNQSSNIGSMLYVPCINNQDSNSIHGKYCILGVPIGSNNDNASFDDSESLNNPSSFVLENLTARPVGIAMINSSQDASDLSALSSSVSSPSLSEQETPYSMTRNQTSDSNSNDTEDNHTQLLIIASPNHINNDSSSNHYSGNNYGVNKVTRISYVTSNYSADSSDSQANESTIYRVNIFGSAQSQKSNSNDLQNNMNSDRSDNYYVDANTNAENSSRYDNQTQGHSPKVATLLNYPDGQLGKVVVVAVPSNTNSSFTSASTLILNSFGLNDTTAFVIDHGFSNSSAQSASTNLPEIMMLDVKSGNFVPFLTRSPTYPNFMPVDVAFDYIHNDLYVLSISKNLDGREASNDSDNQSSSGTSDNYNNGVIWRISYHGKEEETIANSTDSTSENGTDNSFEDNSSSNNENDTNETTDESSSNDTSLNDSNTDTDTTTDSSSFDEGADDVNDEDIGDGSSVDQSSSSSDSDSNSSSATSSDNTSDENDEDNSASSSSDSSSSEDTSTSSSSSSSPDDDSSSSTPQPSPKPENEPPEAKDDAATTVQGKPVLIDVLANDSDKNDGDTLTIDSVDERSIQGGNVKIVSTSSGSSSGAAADDATANNDMNNNNNDDDNSNNDNTESNTNAKIQYTPAEGFIGNDEFTYTIIDSAGATDTAKVTVTVGGNIITPQPISYWLENEDGITENTLEKAANGNGNDNNGDFSFKLGKFEVPKDFDVSDSENDTKGILEAGQGGSNVNTFDQLAAQLLASKLNIQNAASICDSIENSIEDADSSLRTNQYDGPSSSENLTDESSESTQKLIESLDKYNNNNGCS